MKEISVYKTTTDNWCGSYKIYKWPIELVEISYTHYEDRFYIVATGTDDYSLILRYEDEKKALTDFMVILGMSDVTIESLKAMGFELNC